MHEEQFQYAGCTVKIIQDDCSINPREDYDHMGKMILFPSRNYRDVNEYDDYTDGKDFESTLRSLAWNVTKSDAMEDDLIVPMEHVLRCVNKHYVIIPIWRNGYGGMFGASVVVESDSGCDGFILFPVSDLPKEGISREQAVKNLECEIEEYSAWCTGDVYGYVIEDENGNELDSCWGFYGQDYAIESARESAKSQRYVPVEGV